MGTPQIGNMYDPPPPPLKINNIVATFKLCIIFTTEAYQNLAKRGINCEYQPSRFHSIIMRIRMRKGVNANAILLSPPELTTVSALVFRNGKVVLSGCPSLECVKKAAFRINRRINLALAFNRSRIMSLKIHNVAGSFTHPFKIAISRLYNQLCDKKSLNSAVKIVGSPIYDPTRFPALRFKLLSTNFSNEDNNLKRRCISLLVFHSGKCILTGGNHSRQLEDLMIPLTICLNSYSV
jgi:TATA-box binding protein (TBP) (component of TFIID and TFIIIB)